MAGGFWGDGRATAMCPSSNPGSQRQPELSVPQEHPSLHPPGEIQQRRGVARGEQLPAPRGGVSVSRGCAPSAPPVCPELLQFPLIFFVRRVAGSAVSQLSHHFSGGEVTLLKGRVFSRITLKSLKRVCVDPDATWVKKLLQDLPHL